MNTRFVASPTTGHLHISAVRTAIFNWLLARQTGGRFLLRIDDINLEHYVPDAIDRIGNGLRWLGLDWDDYFHQSDRVHDYNSVCERLLKAGLAYRCYCTAKELELERTNEINAGRPHRYSGRCRYIPFNINVPFAVRIDVRKIVDRLNEVGFDDVILGEVLVRVPEIDDFVIRRRDGTFRCDFATAVDDSDFGITHVVREQEHLRSTVPQIVLLLALGMINNRNTSIPTYAHVPYICAPNSLKKLSKTNADSLGICVTLDQYMELGYLPEAIINCLVCLGGSFDGKWSMAGLLERFKLEKIAWQPAIFDPNELYRLQRQWVRSYDRDMLVEILHRKHGGDRRLIFKILDMVGKKFTLLSDFKRYLHFFEEKYFILERNAAKSLFVQGMPERLSKLRDLLEKHKDWSTESLETLIRGELAEDEKPAVLHALRAATTGQEVGIGVCEGMSILGKKKVCRRIKTVLPVAKNTEANVTV